MFTIVTATLNAAPTIKRAIESLRRQDRSFEHVVVDGGSSDDTLGLCRRLGVGTIIEAPSSTIYEAWNIGVGAMTGRFLMLLNADDELTPDALARVEETFAADPHALMVAGQADLVTFGGTPAEALLQRFTAVPGGRLDVPQLALGVPAINAMAFRAEVFAAHGAFPTHFRAAGDRAFLLRLALADHPPRVAGTDAILYRYHSHEGSMTLHRSFRQRILIADEHFALASELLDRPLSSRDAARLRFWRRREAAVGTLRHLMAGKLGAGASFAARLAAAEWRGLTRTKRADD